MSTMAETERSCCQMDQVSAAANRIVFQLNVREDKLRYCLWTDSFDTDRTEETICDFKESLQHCNIIHPADLETCNRILQNKAGDLEITTSEIRLYRGKLGYPWFRMHTIPTKDAQERIVAINGVLEEIQSHVARSRRSKTRTIQYDSLFRKAITSNSILSLGFDYITGKRLVSDMDVIPQWLPEDTTLRNFASALFSQSAHQEEQHKLESLLEQNFERGATMSNTSFHFDCRFRDLLRQTQTFRWYRVYHSFTEKTPEQPVCIYLTIMDIQEAKMEELQQMEQSMRDPATGMLNRCAFEKEAMNWLKRTKSDTECSILCAVILRMENTVAINLSYGRAYLTERIGQLGKTVKAFIHPQELCCRYGLGEFAMVLAGNDRETMEERLKILQIACNTKNSANSDVHIHVGYNIEMAEQIEQMDFFLEKAYSELLCNSQPDMREKMRGVVQSQAKATSFMEKPESIDSTMRTLPPLAAHRVFIRTFGHFDVFVNGEAVLFNHPKAKELFALLVDRRGGFVCANEAISCLWEEEPSNKTTLARCRKAAMQLRQTLAQYGIGDIVETINGKRRALVDQCDCDFDQYLHQGSESLPKMIGTYMNEYSWAENSIGIE